MIRKTPQLKKALSYKKDRRNAYGENDKGSRKSIRVRKRVGNRALRRIGRTLLVQVDADNAPGAEQRVRANILMKQRRRFRKSPDMPLRLFVKRRLERRARFVQLAKNAK